MFIFGTEMALNVYVQWVFKCVESIKVLIKFEILKREKIHYHTIKMIASTSCKYIKSYDIYNKKSPKRPEMVVLGLSDKTRF